MSYLDVEDRILIIAGCCSILVLCLLVMVCKLSPWCCCHKCCPFRPEYEPNEKINQSTSGYNSLDVEKQNIGIFKNNQPQKDLELNTSTGTPNGSTKSIQSGVHNKGFFGKWSSDGVDTTDDDDASSIRSFRMLRSSRRGSVSSGSSRNSNRSRRWPGIDSLFDGSSFSADDATSDTTSLHQMHLGRGEILLSLVFDSASNRLRVHIQKVTNLSSKKKRGKIAIKVQVLYSKSTVEKISELFQRLKLSAGEVEENLTYEVHTRPKEPSNNIIVDESLTVPLKKEDVDKCCLRFVCIRYDKYSQGLPLCEALVTLRDYSLEQEMVITKRLTEPQQEEKGEIHIGLTYLPTSQKLSVSTLCVKRLKIAEETDTNSVVFVKMALARRGIYSKKRVHGKKASDEIKWDETLNFDLPREHVSEVSMVISVKQLVSGVGEFGEHVREHALGKVVIGLNSGTPIAQAQWLEVLQSPRQCVTRSHFLFN